MLTRKNTYLLDSLKRRFPKNRFCLISAPYIPERDLISYILSSSLTVYPTLYESFSLFILNSLALGKPVITYNLLPLYAIYAYTPAVIRAPRNFDWIAYKVKKVLYSEDFYKLSEQAKGFAFRFAWDQVMKAEKNIYNNIIHLFEYAVK
jgi:glycosyltransferase involved in cell wall biosynthesis